jgi:AcrR family transcriptional regulator
MNSKSSATSKTSPQEPPRRRYNSTRRSLQAAQTRADVLHAAVKCFDSAGWAGTTVGSIAKEAGVAVETIYSGFGSKKALLRAAMDMAVVGDAEPVPFVEREEFRRLGEGTIDERLRWGIDVVATTHERSAGVWQAIMEAAVGDPEIDSWRAELEAGRRTDVERSFRLVLDDDVDTMTNDLFWVMLGPEVYLKLTGDLTLTREQYETYVLHAVRCLARLD